MLEPGHDPDLPQEPLGPEPRAEAGLQHLERDGAVVAEIASAVDHRHPAVAELPLDGVAGLECGLKALQQIEHGPAEKEVQLDYRLAKQRQDAHVEEERRDGAGGILSEAKGACVGMSPSLRSG